MADPEARRFRPNVRPLLVAIGANVLLAAVFLGLPYVQGRLRASASREQFAAFAACLWGGEPRQDPGLGLPEGQRARFASRVLHAPEGWPGGCQEALAGLEPGSAWLLLPSVKSAEADVRDAVALVRAQLEELQAARRGGVDAIPSKPLRAVDRLVAGLSVRAEQAHADLGLDAEAIRFEGDTALVEPTRVPVDVSSSAPLQIEPRGDGVLSLGLGRRDIVRVRVGAGGLTKQRIERPALVRATVPGPDGPWAVWAMDEGQCAEEEHRCARHATGLAPLPEGDDDSPPTPVWVAAHPEGRAERSIWLGPDREARLVARREGVPGAALRQLELPERPEAPAETRAEHASAEKPERAAGEPTEPAEPLQPARSTPLEGYGPEDAALVLSDGRVAWTEHAGAGLRLRLHPRAGEGTTVEGASGPAWLLACAADGVQWVGFGASGRAAVVRMAPDEAAAIHELSGLALDAPAIHPVDEAVDAVRQVCDREMMHLLARAPDGVLRAVACDAEGCGEPTEVATGAKRFAAARDAGATVVAWAREAREAQIRVTVVPADARPRTPPAVPAACWTLDGGFCGAPLLAARNGRFVLAGRDGAELLLLESTDGGASWRPMRGLR